MLICYELEHFQAKYESLSISTNFYHNFFVNDVFAQDIIPLYNSYKVFPFVCM